MTVAQAAGQADGREASPRGGGRLSAASAGHHGSELQSDSADIAPPDSSNETEFAMRSKKTKASETRRPVADWMCPGSR